jgi:hypothetical protein
VLKVIVGRERRDRRIWIVSDFCFMRRMEKDCLVSSPYIPFCHPSLPSINQNSSHHIYHELLSKEKNKREKKGST